MFDRVTCSSSRILLSSLALATAATVALGGAGCSKTDDGESKPAQRPPVSKLDAIPGMRYYVGGPALRADKFGRLRLRGFNGEVSAPTTRGLLLGMKVEDGKFDYRTWVNGRIVSSSVGFLDEEGLLWYTERWSYDFDGKTVSHQSLEYDDEREIQISVLELLDPETQEVVQTIEADIPYRPVEDDEEDSFWTEGDEEEGEATQSGAGAN